MVCNRLVVLHKLDPVDLAPGAGFALAGPQNCLERPKPALTLFVRLGPGPRVFEPGGRFETRDGILLRLTERLIIANLHVAEERSCQAREASHELSAVAAAV